MTEATSCGLVPQVTIGWMPAASILSVPIWTMASVSASIVGPTFQNASRTFLAMLADFPSQMASSSALTRPSSSPGTHVWWRQMPYPL